MSNDFYCVECGESADYSCDACGECFCTECSSRHRHEFKNYCHECFIEMVCEDGEVMKIEEAKKIISICEVGYDCTGCPALNNKNFHTGCVPQKDIAYRTIIADKDRQIEELKNEIYNIAKHELDFHTDSFDEVVFCDICHSRNVHKKGCFVKNYREIIEKYTKESEQPNE